MSKIKDSIEVRKEIDMGAGSGVCISAYFYSIPMEERNRIEEITDKFLNSVAAILEEKTSP
jgi:hypothetical protein